MQALYPKYSLLFLFDNITNYSLYSKDVFQVKNINKSSGKKQPILQNSWFNCENICISQPTYTMDIQKKKFKKEFKNLWEKGYLATKKAKIKLFKA